MTDFRDLVHQPQHKRRFEKLLRLAAKRGDSELVAERLSWGIDPNGATKNGRTPLMTSVRGSVPVARVVELLLSAGADPGLLDINGLTALDYANRKLAGLSLHEHQPPEPSPSLDENGQIIFAPFELEMFAETRRDNPDIAKEFITGYMKERP